jgi:hypothetical protein
MADGVSGGIVPRNISMTIRVTCGITETWQR